MKIDLSKVEKKYKVAFVVLIILGVIANILLGVPSVNKLIFIPILIVLGVGSCVDCIIIILQGIKK